MKKFFGIGTTPLLIGIVIMFLHFTLHSVRVLGMNTSIFYMDEQITLAAYFTFTISFLVGAIALLNYRGKYSIWNISYIAFFFMLSMDEYFELHEKAREYIDLYLNLGELGESLLRTSWIFALIIPIIFILVGLMLNAYKEKDLSIKRLKFAGITCFFLVLIFELLGGQNFEKLIYIFFTGVEEGLEMIGISLFFWSEFNKLDKKLSKK